MDCNNPPQNNRSVEHPDIYMYMCRWCAHPEYMGIYFFAFYSYILLKENYVFCVPNDDHTNLQNQKIKLKFGHW